MAEIEKKAAEYKKNYERYLKIAKKIKNDDDRFFLVDFLLKEGRKNAEKEKWHDLREDPKDVPNDNRDVLVLLWDCDDYYIGYYREEYDDMIKGNTYWHFNDFDITEDKLDNILAWIELPKFKEK